MSLAALIQKSGIKNLIPDRLYLAIKYRWHFGYWMSFKHPRTFNEKLQWLKLYDRRPEYVTMVDKYAVKKYVADIIGEEYIIPTIGVWNRGEDIEWEKLPDRFVLKCTHDSGGLVICKDKSKLDKEAAIKKLNNSLKKDYSLYGREWAYKYVPRRIIAEEYIDPAPDVTDLPDYKWYCFNGVPTYCQVIQDRTSKETIDFFDTDWNHQEFVGLNPEAGKATEVPSRPQDLEQQIEIARKLSNDMPFSRIDLYEVGEKIYFGEITLFPTAGTGRFSPDKYNELIGDLIKLPTEKRGGVIIKVRHDGELEITQPDLMDYKVFCFNGVPKMIQLDYNRFSGHLRNLYTEDWKRIDATLCYPTNPDKEFERPEELETMLSAASKLSQGMPHVRADFYIVNHRVLFGELTLFHGSGFEVFTPSTWDEKLGSWIALPGRK